MFNWNIGEIFQVKKNLFIVALISVKVISLVVRNKSKEVRIMLSISKMISSVLAIGSVAILVGCNENPSATTPPAPIQKDGVSIPNESYEYSLQDYQEMFAKEVSGIPALAKRAEGLSLMDLEKIQELSHAVDSYYEIPNFDEIETEEQLKRVEELLGMSRTEIAQNADQIREKRIAGKRYLLYQEILEEFKGGLEPIPLAKTGYIGGISDKEFWILFYSPTFIDGTVKAVEHAKQLERDYYGSNSGATKGDAFRHAIWNHLMADFNSHEVNYKSEAAAWAKKFADAHETGGNASTGFYDFAYPTASELDHAMDYHNNARGRDYFLAVSNNRGKLNWWGYDSRWVETISPSIAALQIYYKSKDAIKFTNGAQLPPLAKTQELAYIQ